MYQSKAKKGHLTYFMPTATSLEALENQKTNDFASFVRYRRRVPQIPLEKAFKLWWAFYGPVAFYKSDDSNKYRKELFKFVQDHIEQAEDMAHVEDHSSQPAV